MFKKLAFFILLNLLITNPSKAFEITNIEWNILNHIQITIYDPTARNLKQANCTVFYIPEENKPIGGDAGLFRAGIAQVTVDVPKSYRTTYTGEEMYLKNFKITCK